MEKDRRITRTPVNLFAILRSLPFFKTKKRTIITFIILAILGYFVFNQANINKNKTTYQTSKVEKNTIIQTVSASGQVSAANSVSVNTLTSGVVKNVYVKNGDSVNAGDTIADIEPDAVGQQQQFGALAGYLAAQNSLNVAQAKMNSLQNALFVANQTFVNGAGTANPDISDPKYIEQRANWLQAEADYKNQAGVISQAQSSLASAAQTYQLSSAIIKAPLSGKISDLSLIPGTVLASLTTTANSASSNSNNQNQSLQKVAAVRTGNTIEVVVNLAEIDAPNVKTGDKVTVTFDAIPNKTFTGSIYSINTTGVVSSGVTNYPALITLDTGSNEIFPNMSATASIIIDTRTDVLSVPNSAIQTQGGNTFVRIVKNGSLTQVPVTIGIASDTDTEIISGLTEGEEVVTATINPVKASGSTSSTSPFGGGLRIGGFGGGGNVRGGGAAGR